MATSVLGLKTFTASDPVDYNEINDNYNKIDNGVKTALQGRAAYNLLDNSWFANPVNQRGKTSWADWNDYTVDRWIFRNNRVSEASVGVSGMSITTGSSEIYLEQAFNKSAMQCYIGKPLTLVFSTNEGLLIKKWTVVDGSYGRESIGNFQMTIGCMTNGWIDLVVPANKTINIYWAALYEGSYTADTLPAYQPKGYAAELAECQRYYNVIPYDLSIYNVATDSAYPSRYPILFPQRMRITPTATLNESWNSNVKTSETSYVSANGLCFTVSANSTGYTEWHGSITLSADL